MSSAAFSQRRVLVVGQRLAAVVEQALAGAQIDAANVDAFDGAARLPAPADLVVIDTTTGDPAKLASLIGALAQTSPQPAAILVGSQLPISLARALLKLRSSDVLDHPATTADLARCAAALLADGAAVMETAPQAQCWSVLSAVGGAGGTTLTIELATTLAGRTLGDRVALIDLNLADGAASAYLGAAANMHLADASAAPERIDAGAARRLLAAGRRRVRPVRLPARPAWLQQSRAERRLAAAGGRLSGLRLDPGRPAARPAAVDNGPLGRVRTRSWWSPS